MVTLPSALAPVFLRVTRANAPFVTADGARRRVRERALRPVGYGPPSQLRHDIHVEAHHEHGWPIYTLTPAQSTPTGTVVYLHGGAWVHEVAPQHWQLAAQIAAEAATTVILPIYPLVPFGTAEEAAEVVTSLVHSRAQFGPVSLAGDSAGGQIALSVAQRLRDQGVALHATVLISPAVDLTWSNPRIPDVQPTDPWLAVPGGHVFADHWRGELDLRDPVVSPLFGDFAGLGPLTIFTGTRDILNPDAHLLVANAEAAGVKVDFTEVAGQLHVYPLLPTKLGVETRRVIVSTLRTA